MAELKLNKDERKFLVNVLNYYYKDAKNPKEVQRLIKKIEKSMKPITVASAKNKGRTLQYWVCEYLATVFGCTFNQSDDNCPIHSREMGQHNVDIVLRDYIYDLFRYDIECKAQESLSLGEWIEQAKTNKREGRDWLLVIKKQSIGEPFVVLDWGAFMNLYMDSCKFRNYLSPKDSKR